MDFSIILDQYIFTFKFGVESEPCNKHKMLRFTAEYFLHSLQNSGCVAQINSPEEH